LILTLIAALDRENGIGREGKIPWHLRADLRMFKALTMGHHLLMGRKTYESIGRKLPGRTMIVLTRQNVYDVPGIQTAHSVDQAIALAADAGERELFVVGGGEVYDLVLARARRAYLTLVDTIAGCDVFFPEVDWNEWLELERGFHPADEQNEYRFEFCRKNRP